MDNPAAPIPSTPPQPAVQPEVFSPVEPSNRHWLLWLAGGLFMLIIGIAIGVFSAKFFSQSTTQSQISSYEDCLTAKGSIVQYSYPATCVTDSGQRFVQPLTDEEKQSLQPPDLNREPDGSAATANWKTYENKEHGYTVEYPSDYKLFFDGKTPIIMKPGGEREGTGAFSFYKISFTSLDTSKELRDLVTENINTTKQVWGVDSPEVKSISPIYEAMVGNLNGLSFDMVCVGYCHNIFIKKDATKSFQITVRNANQEVKNIYQSEVDQILSTFHFLK